MTVFRCCIAVLTMAVVLAGCQPGDLEISDAWIRSSPPGASATAGYLRLVNRSPERIEICSVRSEDFESAEIHRSELVDGVARMRRQRKLVSAVNATVELRPGALHLMLMGARGPLQAGQEIGLQLGSCDGQYWSLRARVQETAS